MAGRPRQFDRQWALERAVAEFWANGYDQTTVATLTAAMGITPPSLYAAFGDKERLFAEAAGCYAERTEAGARRALDRPTLLASLTELLAVTAAAHTAAETPRGCFVLTEPRLASERARLREVIRDRLRRGIDAGDLDRGSDPEAIADYLLAVMTGMSARARDGARAGEVEAIAEIALGGLAPQLAPGTTSPLS